jgi:hypothetical protein
MNIIFKISVFSFFFLVVGFQCFSQIGKLVEAFTEEEIAQLQVNPSEMEYQLFLAEQSAFVLEAPEEKSANYHTISVITLKKTGEEVPVTQLNPQTFNPLLYNLEALKQYGVVKLEGTPFILSVLNDDILEKRYKNYQKTK